MKLLEILTLRGPNYWSRRPVLEAWVDLEALKDSPSCALPGLYERLVSWLPSLIEHRCGVGERGGFLQRLREGTYAAHMLEHVTIELQNLAGTPVGFGKARETSRPGIYRVAVRYRDEKVGRAALEAGLELLLAAIFDRPFDVAGEVTKLRAVAREVVFGPSTAAILAAAEARGIPVWRMSSGSLVQLGQGAQQRRLWTAETDRTGAIAEYIAHDKELTKTLLRAGGVPVPEGRSVESAEDAWTAACELGLPVVVKPRDGNHGRAVFTEVSTKEETETAYAYAREEGSGVLVERFVPGNEHRLLVVAGTVVAAAKGESAYVIGDGIQTVRALVESQLNSDPRRGERDDCPLNRVELDAASRLELTRQGFDAAAVPLPGVQVLIQRNGNVAHDVTDLVHPDVASQVLLAAQIVGLDIAGVDLVARDIAVPLCAQGAAVVEVNSGPGLLMHLRPASGKPRPVGEAIIASLYPDGSNGRIPVVGITGSFGAATVARLVAHLLGAAHRMVGLACSDGLWVGGRQLDRADCSTFAAARNILANPSVAVAVLEAGGSGILRDGLGFDRCDVAVVTDAARPEHLREMLTHHFIDTPDELFTVRRCPVDVVLPTGTAVLNAADPLVANMAPLCAGSVTFFAQAADHPVLVEHRAKQGRAVFIGKGALVVADGAREVARLPLPSSPLTDPNPILAGVAAAWAIGLAEGQLRSGLSSFSDAQSTAS